MASESIDTSKSSQRGPHRIAQALEKKHRHPSIVHHRHRLPTVTALEVLRRVKKKTRLTLRRPCLKKRPGVSNSKTSSLSSKAAYEKALEIIEIQSQALADKKLLRTENALLKKERLEIDRLIYEAVRESEAKATSRYEALKEDSDRIQKNLMAENAQLRREVKGKESVIEHLRQYQDDYDRLKAIEKKWLAQEKEKEAKARQAEEAAKARQPKPEVRKAPMLQSLSPPQSQPQQEERKNLSLGR